MAHPSGSVSYPLVCGLQFRLHSRSEGSELEISGDEIREAQTVWNGDTGVEVMLESEPLAGHHFSDVG